MVSDTDTGTVDILLTDLLPEDRVLAYRWPLDEDHLKVIYQNDSPEISDSGEFTLPLPAICEGDHDVHIYVVNDSETEWCNFGASMTSVRPIRVMRSELHKKSNCERAPLPF
jgi:hypothetical protein